MRQRRPFGSGPGGLTWRQAWAIARYDLHLSDSEFLALTLPAWAALTERWKEEQKRLDFRFGILASVLVNINVDREKTSKVFEPSDFFSSLHRDPREQTSDSLINVIETIFSDAIPIEPPPR